MHKRWPAVFAAFVISSGAFAQTTAPRSGTLVIQGGGESTVARDEFIRLAGGAKANIVVIPTAAGLDSYGEDFQANYFRGFREQGVTAISLLHTTSRQTADSDAFVAPLANATGVWFPGGRQWRLADAYLGTKTEAALWRLLERGGVIGGTSAGATILGSYLTRGDTRGALPPMGDHERGFAFLRNCAIDQHILVRNRQFDLIPVIHAHPELLGLGIDQDAAIVVQGDEFRVLTGYVAIYDPALVLANDRFYFLEKGERFRLSNRTPMSADGKPRWMPQLMPPAKLTAAQLGDIAGTYRAGEHVIRIVTSEGQVKATLCPGDERELIPLSADLWFEKYEAWKLTIHRAPDGKVSGFTWNVGPEVGIHRCVEGTVEAVRTGM